MKKLFSKEKKHEVKEQPLSLATPETTPSFSDQISNMVALEDDQEQDETDITENEEKGEDKKKGKKRI